MSGFCKVAQLNNIDIICANTAQPRVVSRG